jgi:hypothetical protein
MGFDIAMISRKGLGKTCIYVGVLLLGSWALFLKEAVDVRHQASYRGATLFFALGSTLLIIPGALLIWWPKRRP